VGSAHPNPPSTAGLKPLRGKPRERGSEALPMPNTIARFGGEGSGAGVLGTVLGALSRASQLECSVGAGG
jgi:hypothetical protein